MLAFVVEFTELSGSDSLRKIVFICNAKRLRHLMSTQDELFFMWRMCCLVLFYCLKLRMDENVVSIAKSVHHAIFLLMVMYILNWQLCQTAFVYLCVVRRKGRLPWYCVINVIGDSIWHVWHLFFRLFLLEARFALVVESLLAMSDLVTRTEDFFSVFDAFCGEIAIQLVDASCGLKHHWELS